MCAETINSSTLPLPLINSNYDSLLVAVVFAKGHLDECLVIANAKGQYGGDRVGKKAGRGRYGGVTQDGNHTPVKLK